MHHCLNIDTMLLKVIACSHASLFKNVIQACLAVNGVCHVETGILCAGLIGAFHTDWGLSFNNMKGAELPLPAYSSTQNPQAER